MSNTIYDLWQKVGSYKTVSYYFDYDMHKKLLFKTILFQFKFL